MTVTNCLAVLEAMNAGSNQNFEAISVIYAGLLSSWGEELSSRVVKRAALHCKWRPSPAELRETAARLESPVPSADDAMYEVSELVNRYGVHGRPDPQNPRVRVPGPPPFSHPLIERTVRYSGGWENVCDGKAQYQEGGLRGSFKATYSRSEIEWVEAVAVCLESGTRPAAMFPVWKPFGVAAAPVAIPEPAILPGELWNGGGAIVSPRYSRLSRGNDVRVLEGATR